MTQPEALRLADLLEKAPAHTLEDGTITLYLGGTVVADKAAAELRRLAAVEAQRDALLKALKEVADYLADTAICGADENVAADARAAIKAAEEKA